MKNIMMFFFLLISGTRLSAQTLEEINEYMKKNQYAAAKAGIDKFLADPKNVAMANTWFYKGTIYNNYSNDTTISTAMAYDLKAKAFEAYKKTAELDKLDLYLRSDEYRQFLYIYSGMFNLGAKQFGEKDYAAAINSFQKAQEAEDYILSKNYQYPEMKFTGLDTTLTLNIGAAHINLKNDSAAARIYRKLTDANVSTPENEHMYIFLTNYYHEQKDDANLNNILAKARKAYPQNVFWDEIETDRITKSGDKKAMFSRYEDLYVKNPGNFANTYNYGVEIYNSIYGKEPDNPDPAAAKEKLTAVMKSAIAVDTGIDAVMLMTNHLYNYASEYSQQAALVTGTKPDDLKKKKDLVALSNAKLDEMIPYAENAVKYYQSHPPVKASLKINYKNALDYLSETYTIKKNPNKAAEYDKLKDAIKF